MNDSPEISVLMSVYNSDQFILDSISSVLNQTFSNFEFIIIDDGSTDNSLNIIKSISDDRIRLFVNNQNRGLIFSLNKGVELAKGKYIVRMDSDDLCFPNRLELQYNFMQTHPEIGVCGSDYDNFSETFYKSCHTIKGSEVLKVWLLFSTPLCHPTVIIRKSILPKDPYDVNFLHVEDYELWTRLALTSSIENLPETLLKYRHHPAQVSNEKRSEQLIRVKEIQR
ncbi:MAG: glycosyltransferase family 2 protein, partial [Bacteroidota bacterium]